MRLPDRKSAETPGVRFSDGLPVAFGRDWDCRQAGSGPATFCSFKLRNLTPIPKVSVARKAIPITICNQHCRRHKTRRLLPGSPILDQLYGFEIKRCSRLLRAFPYTAFGICLLRASLSYIPKSAGHGFLPMPVARQNTNTLWRLALAEMKR